MGYCRMVTEPAKKTAAFLAKGEFLWAGSIIAALLFLGCVIRFGISTEVDAPSMLIGFVAGAAIIYVMTGGLLLCMLLDCRPTLPAPNDTGESSPKSTWDLPDHQQEVNRNGTDSQ
jgi:hypothetical protein